MTNEGILPALRVGYATGALVILRNIW